MVSLFNLLKSTGLPVAYHHFTAPPTPPYIVYLFTDSENFGADNRVYVKGDNYQVELYTDKKDLVAEGKIETALDGASIFYDKTELYIETEKLYQVIYHI